MSESPSEEVMREARELAVFMPLAEDIARALSAAEARGRQNQREEDAAIAEAYPKLWDDPLSAAVDIRRFVATEIAAAIRNQGQKT